MRGLLIAATIALGVFGWIAQGGELGGGGSALSDEELVEQLANSDPPPVLESLTPGKKGMSIASIAIDVAIYASLALLIGGIVLYAKKAVSDRMPQGDSAAAEFEAALLAEMMTGGTAAAAAAPEAPDSAPTDAANAAVGEAVADESQASTSTESDSVAAETGEAESPSDEESGADSDATPPPTLKEVANELRRLRPDLEPRGPVANLGGATGVGLAVGWNSGRSSAVIVADLPPAFALPNLLRRFDAVIVAPPSSATEPVIIDRASNFFLRDLHVG